MIPVSRLITGLIFFRVSPDVVASGRKNWRALVEKGLDAFFDVGSSEDPMAVGQSAVDRLRRRLCQRHAHAGADEAESEGRATS